MSLNKVFQEITKVEPWLKIAQAIKSESTYKIASPNSLFPVMSQTSNPPAIATPKGAAISHS